MEISIYYLRISHDSIIFDCSVWIEILAALSEHFFKGKVIFSIFKAFIWTLPTASLFFDVFMKMVKSI